MSLIPFVSEWVVRSFILILAGAVLVWLLRVKNPSTRLTAWTVMLAGSLAIPLLTRTLPIVPLDVGPPEVGAGMRYFPAPATRDLVSAPAPIRSVATKPVDWMRIAAILYVLAAGALLLRLFLGLILSLRILRQSGPTGIRAGGTEVRESGHVVSPVTIGIIRPAVLLPLDWRNWDSAKLNAVLAHERSHIRRGDPALQFFSAIHRALLWANPLSWFLHRSIVRAAEEISDDDAITATRDRISYAEILLELMQRGVGQTNWLGVPMARYDLPEKRIRRILNSSGVPRRVTRWSIAAIVAVGAPLACLIAAARAQESIAPGTASFEVASIKVNKSGDRQASFEMSSGGERLVVRNLNLAGLILRAYDVSDNQVSGNSPALSFLRETSLRYDLDAKAEHPVSRSDMMRMLQTLLAARFQLRLHRETREVSGYVLVIAEGGSKLSEHTGPPVTDCAGGRGNDGEFIFQSCPISFFASQILTAITGGAYVADKTGLQGSYDFHLMASWELPPPNPAEYPDAGNGPRIMNPGAPSVFTALPKQLGLKLERQRVAVQFIYIDHAEKPSGN